VGGGTSYTLFKIVFSEISSLCLAFVLCKSQKYCFHLCRMFLCSDSMLPLLSLQNIGNTKCCLLKYWAFLKIFLNSFLLLVSYICLILLFIHILFFSLRTLLASVLSVSYISRLALVLNCRYFFLASFF